MMTLGGRFGPRTRMPIVASPGRPAASVTAARMVCVPTRSVERVKVDPRPRSPSRLEDQESRAPRSPSSASFAAPLKVIGLPARNTPWFGGEVIATTGASSVTVTRSRGAAPPSRDR